MVGIVDIYEVKVVGINWTKEYDFPEQAARG